MIRLEDFVSGGPLILRSLETIDVAGGDVRGRFNTVWWFFYFLYFIIFWGTENYFYWDWVTRVLVDSRVELGPRILCSPLSKFLCRIEIYKCPLEISQNS